MQKNFLELCNQAKQIISETHNESPSLLMVRLKITLDEANQILEHLHQPNTIQPRIHSEMKHIDFDSLDGHAFENFCADILRYNGFSNIQVTQGSGDFGVDILCNYKGNSYAIQCKCYSNVVGNKAVQEVFSGRTFYNCDKAVVITNNYFTAAAEETARMTGVELWDRHRLKELLLNAYNNGFVPRKY